MQLTVALLQGLMLHITMEAGPHLLLKIEDPSREATASAGM